SKLSRLAFTMFLLLRFSPVCVFFPRIRLLHLLERKPVANRLILFSSPLCPLCFRGSSRLSFCGRIAASWSHNRHSWVSVPAVQSKEKKEGEPQEITQLLIRWSKGDNAARDELMPLVHSELRRLAGRCLRHEPRNGALQPTALVHDAFIRLVQQNKVSFQNRAQFYGLCATIMRNILVERARARKAAKRSGGWYRISISKADRI